MKERMEKLTAVLSKKDTMSRLDLVLGLLAALLSGIIIGFLICPKRQTHVSYNGNSRGNGTGPDCHEEECAGGKCCEDCDEERCCGEQEYCGNSFRCCEEGPDEEHDSDEQDVNSAE